MLYSLSSWPAVLRLGRTRSGANNPDDLGRIFAAALAGPVLFVPLWRLWLFSFGDGAVGVLPLMIGAGVALVAAGLVRVGGRRVDQPEVVALGALMLSFLALAVPIQLARQWLTIGWALEVVLLGLFFRRVRHGGLAVFAGGLVVLVLGRLFFNPEAWTYGGGEGLILLNWTLYVWGVPTLCLLIGAWAFDGPAAGPGVSAHGYPWFARALRIGAIALGFALVNLEVAHAFAYDGQLSFWSENLSQSMVRSVSWGLYGLTLIAIGSAKNRRWTRVFGLGFLLLGAAKVFVLDLWSLTGFYRVGSIFGLAVVLILGAIAFQRLVLKDREDR